MISKKITRPLVGVFVIFMAVLLIIAPFVVYMQFTSLKAPYLIVLAATIGMFIFALFFLYNLIRIRKSIIKLFLEATK